ncbi:MAG: type IX secretion system outer membrane channel protein PorV [Bacteroidia bacterium]
MICAVSPFTGRSQVSTQQLAGAINPITTSVPFLLIAPDSRQGGMGEVGAATQPDVNSIHWNGSKLAFAEKSTGIGISYTPWLRQLVPDISLSYLSAYHKLKNKTTAIGGSLRYFSLGNITFTDISGNTTGQFKPNEFAIDFALSQKLSDNFSAGIAIRYINSNLTGGVALSNGQATRPGQSVAADVSMYYRTPKGFEVADKKSTVSLGLAITNIGQKISYSTAKNFIPTNMRLGGGLKMDIDDYNSFGFYADLNKLLVPTPPVYQKYKTVNGTDSSADYIDPATNGKVVAKGKDPNVPVAQGMIQSFYDAPGGFKEELREINIAVGFEYWYAKQFAVRAGYFYEDKTKGGRQFFTIGLGVRYSVFGLDMAYLIPTTLRNPLQNTLRFTLSFDFDAFKSQNKDTGGGSAPTSPF